MELVKPNVLISGVPHSGTSIVASMLRAMGWAYEEPDRHSERRSQHRWFTQCCSMLNNHISGKVKMSDKKLGETLIFMRKKVSEMKQPFILNDGRTIICMKYWVDILMPYNPVMIMLCRNKERLKRSFEARSQTLVVNGKTVPGKYGYDVYGLTDKANEAFDLWPGVKVKVNYDKIVEAIKLFDVSRQKAHGKKFGKSGI